MSPTSNKHRPVVEAEYIGLARTVVACQDKEREFHARAREVKQQCAKAMHSVNVSTFSFGRNDGKHFLVKLERPWADRIHTRKLYTLLAGGEISLDEFLDCIVAPIKAVEETLGEERAQSLLESYRKGLDLVITEG